jgi:signal transduction histidine kinase
VFFAATVAVIIVGFIVARRITKPLNRLVFVSTAVAQGNLDQSTEIESNDEIGALASSFDIMTKRLAERNRQLVEQASELEAILNSISDAVIVINNDNQIVVSNPAAEMILDHLAYHDDTPATYLQSSKANIQSGLQVDTLMALDTTTIDTTRFRVGGRIFGISASLFKAPTGNELGRVIVLRDVTRQAEAEQLKDGFITSISHELRTPLTSMKGYIHLLSSKNSSNLTDQQTKFIEIIQNSTELLATHVNKLIDITSIQEGSLKLKKQRESLKDIVLHQTNEWREKMESKGLEFQVELGDDSLWAMIDRTRLDWAIENILRNAHHYTTKDGKVTVRLLPQHGHACLTIRDTGVGISAVDQPYIFSRFYRAQNELTLSVPGLGIELFIAKSIVEAHDGRIWVESELGRGSTFGIDLALAA